MKRFLCLLLCLCLLPVFTLGEEETQRTGVAPELDLPMMDGRTPMDQAALRDGDDATGYAFKRNKSVAMTTTVPEEMPVYALYIRMDPRPASIQLQRYNGKKWETVVANDTPLAEAILRPKTPLSGEIRVTVTFDKSAACTVTELRCFGEGKLNDRLHDWKRAKQADVMILCDSLDSLDPGLIARCAENKQSPVVCVLTKPLESVTPLTDTLWDAGLRVVPVFGDFAAAEGNRDQLLKKWGEAPLKAAITGWIRKIRPLVLLTSGRDAAGEILDEAAADAAVFASDYLYDEASAGESGVWVTGTVTRADSAGVDDLLKDPGSRNEDGIRTICANMWSDAQHGDPATIPYPAGRQEDGYLPEGEFVFEDPDHGLWAYLSDTVQVEIVRYEQPDVPRVWFMTELYFKPEAEKLQQVVYTKAAFKDQQTYPETLAQNANLVLGINGDYYPYRINRKTNTGNILRNYEVLYDYNPKKQMTYPNLDTMALNDDGTMTVYDVETVTATELAATGTVHDALSFGPWLARDGKLRIYAGPHADDNEPRSAIGMVEAGHYWIVTAEGKMPKGGPAGITINQAAMLLYGQGVNVAFNLDGGSTSVLIFMGTKLNRTGKGNSIGSPRNMHELFGIGTSPSTHTDMLDGKEK